MLEAAAILGLLLFPDMTVKSARDALMLFGRDVLPTLLPYIFFCRILGRRLGQRRGRCGPVVLVLGLLGGSPSGAALLSQCAYEIPEKKRYALIAVVSTISPMFLLNTVNSWVSDPLLCRLLLCSHVLGALFAGALIWKTAPSWRKQTEYEKKAPAVMGSAIMQSVLAILNVGGCIVVYTVIATLIQRFPGISPQTGALVHAALEVAGGMKALCGVYPVSMHRAVLLAAAAGFGGMSIMAQNHEFLADLGISKRKLIGIGLLKAGLSACMMIILYLFCFRS